MTKDKIAKYIVIGVIVLLAVVLILVIINERKSPVSHNERQNAPSGQKEGSFRAIESSELGRGVSILWATGRTYDGNLGGRRGADKICRSEIPSALYCSNIHAFISVKTDDSVKDMPKKYNYNGNRAIYWYNKSTNKFLLAANNWKDLLDGTIINSPDKGVGRRVNYWLGSHPDGSLNYKNCHNWGANSPAMSGAEGRGAVKDARWLGKGSLSCDGKDGLLCICQK